MSTNEQTPISQPTFAVKNTLGKEQDMQDLDKPAFDAALREYCDRLPLTFTNHSRESAPREGTSSRRRSLKERLGSRHVCSMSGTPEPRRSHSESPRKRDPKRKTMFKRLEKGVFHRLGDKGKSTSAYSNDSRRRSYHSSRRNTESCYQSSRSRETEFASEKHHNKIASSRRTKALSESEETAFKQMKTLIEELTMLTAPKEKEESAIYLAATKEFVSAVLMTKRDGKQMPIYFVSRALQGSEINYTSMEKLILALVSASKRLKRYFQAHTVVVITDQPIKQMMSSLKVAGRLLKWRFELEGHDIHYRPRTSVKGQILADFIVEHGSSCIDGFKASLIIMNPEAMEFTYALRFRFHATNNEAEYKALIAGLRIAEQIGVRNLQVNVDSKLVANQINGTYVAKEPSMIKYLENVKNLANTFKEFSIKQVPKGENKKVDALSKMASTSYTHLSKHVLIEELKEKLIDKKEVLAIVEKEGHTWMTSIYEYLTKEILPEEKRKERAIRRNEGRYVVTNEILYKRSFLGPWLRCVRPLQANYVLREIHKGSCSMHADPRSVVAKALRSGYYWPTMHADARKLIRECNSSRPLPEGPGKVKFLIVAIDYFTKWIKAKPMATITGAQIKKIVWDNITCRFNLPGEIISDNEKQFRDNLFKDWCEKLCICQCFASVKNPQANDLVERENKSFGEGIKACNGETPFSLMYGTKAVIPVEISMITLRTAKVDVIKYDEALEINLDLLEKKKEQATIQEAKSKAMIEKYYNARVRNTSFNLRNLVYRNNKASHAKEGGKLGPKWEGPYEVTKALRKGAYKLEDCNESILPRT
uniref:Reverse transcriptase domain-containing protein n=1 Tax=Tanacetum cinerariifolium TaxID=118510 RepID=A0A699GYD7_TANCI|nr:reverse transcriptase domain-containing protein [Tanacetum cinerariifolium]